MARTVEFEGTQLGDVVVTVEPVNQAEAPAVVAGVYRETARVIAESPNRVYGLAVRVTLKRDTPVLFALALQAIQLLAHTRGVVEIFDGVTRELHTDDQWVLAAVGQPAVLAGFGGRFTDDLLLTFMGETAAEED